MTWRERALRAKESGSWCDEDTRRWANRETCPAAEIALGYGRGWLVGTAFSPWGKLWKLGDTLGWTTPSGGYLLPPDDFLERLEEMEDLGVRIKRGEHA